MDKIALLNQIRLNGIDGVDGIIDMIKIRLMTAIRKEPKIGFDN